LQIIQAIGEGGPRARLDGAARRLKAMPAARLSDPGEC
jgi:hypothetical protein